MSAFNRNRTRPRCRVAVLVALCLTLHALGNDPGGGAPTGGADVTISGTASTSTTVTLSNGIISATITKAKAKVTSYTLQNSDGTQTQMLDTSGQIYYSFDGGSSYEEPENCVFTLVTNTTNMMDISCKRTWNSSGGYKHAVDIDVHYVLRRGDTGLYTYAILNHANTYPATSFSEWRMVWKLPHDSDDFFFERAYVDDLRNWKMMSYYDFVRGITMPIKEILKLNGASWNGILGSGYDCKYSYAAEYQNIGVWGHASDENQKGVWIVPGGFDFLNDGPNKLDLTLAESYSLIHFGRDHFGDSITSLAANEAWTKIYGPFLLYCNSTTATTNAGDTLWADAKAQAAAEQTAWPYSWLGTSLYPAVSSRGTVTGTLVVSDPLKPGLSASNAWVGLAAAEDTDGNWQYQNKGYQYWVRANSAGSFTLTGVRPGSYTLYAFSDGIVGEFSKTAVTVGANATNALGNLAWNVTHPGTSIAWEIGIPNRSPKEFKHGSTDYFIPYGWNNFWSEFSNPLEYTVGTSNYATALNYAHTAYYSSASSAWQPWKWRINFNLAAVPKTGNATLTLAYAGSQSAHIDVYVNNESARFATHEAPNSSGDALLRLGNHAKYGVVYVSIPVSNLRVGANTITLIQGGITTSTDPKEHVMYDYLNLELPDFPPSPPSSGRTIAWKGGSTTAANTWDVNTTNSFVINGTSTATAFGAVGGNGDKVIFDDTGSNTTSVTLTGTIEPESVAVSGTKNYTWAGTGSLIGQMNLIKSGTGKLTISGSNSFAGLTTISGGQIAFGNDTANTSGLGTSDIRLMSGTLSMFSDGRDASNNISTWNLDIPVGNSGTLNVDARCWLTGKLTGGGTFNYVLLGSRADLTGDWSQFSGQFNVTTTAGTADFRMGTKVGSTSYQFPGLPSAAVNLGAGISAYYVAAPNGITGTSVSIGELSTSDAGVTLKGGPTAGRSLTYRIGTINPGATFAGRILDQTAGSITNIVKIGTGSWTLSGTSNFTGATTVEQGNLVVTGSLTNTGALQVSDQGTLTVASSGTVTVPGINVAEGGTLAGSGAINSNVSVNSGATLAFAASNGVVTGPNITGNLTVDGTINVTPASGSGAFPTGTYTVATYSGTLTGTATFVFTPAAGANQSATFDSTSTPGQVKMNVTRGPATLNWTGAASSSWNSAAQNWRLNGASEFFMPSDNVIFDDVPTNNSVSVTGSVNPASVSFVNSTKNYTLSGTGVIAGSGVLTKSGAGTLTITPAVVTLDSSGTTTGSPTVMVSSATNLAVGMTVTGTGIPANTTISEISGTTVTLSQDATATGTVSLFFYAANTYSGGTVINTGSTIVLSSSTANASGLGTGTVKFNGGTLKLFNLGTSGTSAGTFSNLIQVDSGSTGALIGFGRGTLASTLLGSGTFNYETDYIRGDVTGNWSGFTGQINATKGQHPNTNGFTDFRINNTKGFGTAKINLASGVAMYMQATPPPAGLTNTIGELTGNGSLSGSATTTRTMTWNVGGANTNVQFDGTIRNSTGPTAIIKSGTGIWTLAGACTYTGSTTVLAGTLRILGSGSGSSSLTIASGAALEVPGAANLSVSGPITNNGTIRLYGSPTFSSTTGALVNNGVIDLINSTWTPPANLPGTGVILQAGDVRALGVSMTGSSLSISGNCYPGHTYKLQAATSLTIPDWTDVSGSSFTPAADVVHDFADPAATGAQKFYRIVISP